MKPIQEWQMCKGFVLTKEQADIQISRKVVNLMVSWCFPYVIRERIFLSWKFVLKVKTHEQIVNYSN